MSVWMKKEDWTNEGFMDVKIIKDKKASAKGENYLTMKMNWWKKKSEN